jgi:hypothetical protein
MVRRGAVAAGGPNLAAAPRTRFEAAAAAVIASPVGSPLVSARYGSRADDGPAGERALILCNLAIDREAFLSAGGFDPRLYPNEENALLHRLQRRGALAVHVHDAPVRKPRPGTLGRFVTESFRYGRGRLEEVWVAPGRGDGIFLAVFLAALAGLAEGRAHPSIPAAYAVVCLVEGLRLARNGRPGVPGRAVVCAGLLVLRHAAYGAGMCWGALTGWRKRTVRWKPMNAVVRRYRVGSNGIRPPDTVSCRIGSMAKEAAANA